MHTHTYTCTHTLIHTHIHTHGLIHKHTYTPTHTHTYTHIYIFTHTYIYMQLYSCTHTHTYIDTHTCPHNQINLLGNVAHPQSWHNGASGRFCREHSVSLHSPYLWTLNTLVLYRFAKTKIIMPSYIYLFIGLYK